MHVLYFHQHFTTPAGAGGTRSYEMSQRLIQAGHSVTMVCGSYGSGETGLSDPFVRGKRMGEVDGIRVIEFELPYSNQQGLLKRTWTFLKFALRSMLVALTTKYDLAFATSTPLTAGIPGIAAKWLRRKRFVFEVRDLWPELPREMGVIKSPLVLWGMSVLEWVSYRSADRCIGLAPGIVDGIARRGVDPSRITSIPNGCDLELFGGSEIVPWRPEGVRDSDLLAVFTGTHGVANGLNAVLDAAKELSNRRCEDIKLVLIGDGKLKSELVQRATKLKLNNVVFHEPVDKRRLSGLLSSADIGMQILANIPAFYRGTSPNKFFDYLAAGLPVLNNYPGWLADLIKANECGIAVPPDSPTAFADALQELAADNQQRMIMGGKARLLGEKMFSRDELGAKFVDFLQVAAS